MNKLKIEVEWDGFGEEKDDEKAQQLYQKSVANYYERFKALPPIGLHLANGYCDAGKIIQVNYDGCNEKVWIYIEF